MYKIKKTVNLSGSFLIECLIPMFIKFGGKIVLKMITLNLKNRKPLRSNKISVK